MEITTFIPEHNFPKLEKKLKSLSRRSVRLGLAPITYTLTGAEEYREVKMTVVNESPAPGNPYRYSGRVNIKVVEITVVGETPVLEGWQFVGRIEHSEIGDIRFEVPDGPGIPARYNTNNCDHCGHKRNRKDTFILRHTETQEFQQVGSTCVKDFIPGANDPKKMLDGAKFLRAIYDLVNDELQDVPGPGPGVPGAEFYFSLKNFLAAVRFVIKQRGRYVKSNEGNSTREEAWQLAFGCEYYDEEYPVPEADEEAADRCIEWWKTKYVNGSSFENNCQQIAKAGLLGWNHGGFAAAMMNSFMRFEEGEARRKKAEQVRSLQKADGWVPVEEGERANLLVFVEHTKEIPPNDRYDMYRTLHIMRDADGHRLTWFSYGHGDLKPGKWYSVTATIRRKTVYRNEKETIVNRVSRKGGPWAEKPGDLPSPPPSPPPARKPDDHPLFPDYQIDAQDRLDTMVSGGF